MNSNKLQDTIITITICVGIIYIIAAICKPTESKPSKEMDLDAILNSCDSYAVVVNTKDIKVDDALVHKVFIKDKKNIIRSCTVEFEVNKGDTLIKK